MNATATTQRIAEGATEADFSLEQSFSHLLHRVGQCATEAFQRKAGDRGLTARQFAVLLTLDRHEGSSQTDIADITGIDRSTLADMVRRMLQRGLIERTRSREDARAYSVRLTEQGRAALMAAFPAARFVDEHLLAGLSADERKNLVGTLAAIVGRLQPTVAPKE